MADKTIYPDISIYQNVLTTAYPRSFVMWRIESEYASLDGHAKQNLATSLALRSSGRLINFGGYVIPDVVSNAAVLAQIDAINFPHDAVVMIDFESWGGKVKGDRSDENNALAEALVKRQNGRTDLVWGYFNRGDGSAGWPTRPAWLGYVVAGYNSNDPRDEYSHCIAWQYTNGTENHTSWPASTPGIGNCDHNALFIPIPTPGGSSSTGDWFDMATKQDLTDVVLACLRNDGITGNADAAAKRSKALLDLFDYGDRSTFEAAMTETARKAALAVVRAEGITGNAAGASQAARAVQDAVCNADSGVLVRVAALQKAVSEITGVELTDEQLAKFADAVQVVVQSAAQVGAKAALDGATIKAAV